MDERPRRSISTRCAPHGACELKFVIGKSIDGIISCAPHGACELKSIEYIPLREEIGCAPHGACELKSFYVTVCKD